MTERLSPPLATAGKIARSTAGFAGRHKLTLRIGVAVVASLLFLLGASEAFFTRAASRELVQQDARAYAADAVALETAYREGSDPADAIDDVLDLVDSMEDRFGIVSARLVDAHGTPVLAPRDYSRDGDPATGPGVSPRPGNAQVITRRDGNRYEFVVPLTLAGKGFTLEVHEDGHVLNGRISALRTEALAFSTVSLLIGMALFYLIVGHALARRHRTAVTRATRDPLTGLGNHRSFQEELTVAVALAERRRESLAVVLVDLDDFKSVNDRYGHRKGDEVLVEVASFLEQGRPDDRAFRIGGDEFALLLPGLDAVGARIAVERRLESSRKSRKATSFSAGVALTQNGVDAPSVLWEQADAALYQGKRAGGGAVVAFDDVAGIASIVTPAKITALRSLLDEPRLTIAFQPIWDLENRRMLGAEALARPWVGYGFNGPGDMFAVAEKLGRAHEIDAICLSAALARAHELPDDVLLFLNVNPQSLAHGDLNGDRLVRAVAAAGLEPARVVLEITESSDARLQQVVADASRLHSLGFGLALDHAGTGDAGLEMLRAIPLDFVKVDRSVVTAAASDPEAQALLVAIVAYARRIGAFVIAEGIESEDMLDFVQGSGELEIMRGPLINGGQGYLLGRPSESAPQLPYPTEHKLVA